MSRRPISPCWSITSRVTTVIVCGVSSNGAVYLGEEARSTRSPWTSRPSSSVTSLAGAPASSACAIAGAARASSTAEESGEKEGVMGGGRQEEWGPAGGGCGRRDNGTTWRAPPSAATDAAAMRKRDGWGTAVPRRRLAWISREREVRGPGAAGARSHRLWGKSGRRRLRTPSWARTRGDGPPAGSVSSAARGGWAGRGVAPRSAAQPSGTRRWRRKRAWTKAGNDAAILNENYSLW